MVGRPLVDRARSSLSSDTLHNDHVVLHRSADGAEANTWSGPRCFLPLKFFVFVEGNVTTGSAKVNRMFSSHTREVDKLETMIADVNNTRSFCILLNQMIPCGFYRTTAMLMIILMGRGAYQV